MGEVVEWDGITTLDIPPARVLEKAMGENLTGVVLIGTDEDGCLFFSSSMASAPQILWLIESLKHELLSHET